MSDSVTAFRRAPLAASLAAGALSCLLYLSAFLSFAFLLPVQLAFGRRGAGAGRAAAGTSAAGIAAILGWRLAAAGAAGTELATAILMPAVLLGALVLLNSAVAGALHPTLRALCAAAACAAAALPAVLAFGSDAAIALRLEGLIRAALAPLASVTAEADGYEASALAAALDPKELAAAFMSVLRDSYAALFFLLLAGSRRLGDRLSGPGSPGRARTPEIDLYRLPFKLVWAFLASWALVLAAEYFRAPAWASAAAWNCALALSMAYAAQGVGILTHLFKSWNLPRSLRIGLAVVAALSVATPTTGLVVAIALPLFGVTEIWIPYRKPKGVGA